MTNDEFYDLYELKRQLLDKEDELLKAAIPFAELLREELWEERRWKFDPSEKHYYELDGYDHQKVFLKYDWRWQGEGTEDFAIPVEHLFRADGLKLLKQDIVQRRNEKAQRRAQLAEQERLKKEEQERQLYESLKNKYGS